MDVSLFERLVRPKENEKPATRIITLDIQHRMHPSISALISTTYPNLRASLEVSKYPEISGMRRRLFWLDHRELDDSRKNRSDSTSHTNMYEVDMVSALVRHLVRQDEYHASDIAVVQVTRPDGFQGEEAKIVIVSLVRSNESIVCTSRNSSRINVLLSRAQHGLYVIGNTETFAQIPMFSEVLGTLKKNDNVGPYLELCCPRHPGKLLKVARPDDFSVVSPEGGCDEPCGKSLSCGHLCIKSCHSDKMHHATKCTKPPTIVKSGCSHSSHSECGGDCDEHCIVQASNINVELACGHHVNTSENSAQAVCSVLVERIFPNCNHKVLVACYVDVEASDYGCTATCGHDYTSCKHACSALCHGDDACPPCIEQCDSGCSHFKCLEKRSEPCAPCVERKCLSCCPHSECSMPCAAPCDWVPCSKCRSSRFALMEESTKRFTVWSHQKYLELAGSMQQEQGELIGSRLDAPPLYCGDIEMSQGFHLDMLVNLPGLKGRYHKLSMIRENCVEFCQQVTDDEKPLKRVYEIVAEALSRHRSTVGETVGSFQHDQILLRTRGDLLAMSLFIRCEVVGIVDFFAVYYAQLRKQGSSFVLNFYPNRELCDWLIESAELSKDILQQAEGHIFWAHPAGLECEVMESHETGRSYDEIRALANAHLDSARELCETHSGQTSSVVDEVPEVRRLLDEGGFQSQMRMVVAAMSKEFSGTGHWYRCANGHPFTIGECGMPMEATRCPQCNAPIGGQNHAPEAGVQSAVDIEREFGSLRVAE